jgi:SAM-dependent methyltransferase
LDAGCGNGRVLGMLAELSGRDQMLFGVDLVAADIAQKNLNHASNVVVSKADLMDYSTLEHVCRPDLIYCQEVLHHTADPQISFRNLVRMLNVGGEIAIYVYKEKAPIREFCDDYVRGQISGLNHDEASRRMLQFAEFGKALSNLNIQIDVPEVSILGISAGSYDLQRFIYHHFMKCYWNDELTLEQNTMINFDWYHPTISSRHSLEEVRSWYVESGLKIIHEYVDEYGITMRGKK